MKGVNKQKIICCRIWFASSYWLEFPVSATKQGFLTRRILLEKIVACWWGNIILVGSLRLIVDLTVWDQSVTVKLYFSLTLTGSVISCQTFVSVCNKQANVCGLQSIMCRAMKHWNWVTLRQVGNWVTGTWEKRETEPKRLRTLP